ncbi:hypothetical protein CkaCkLH20_06566 [Colletotrichum karsti]|uniref:F-box domain-containing protein n=1 Tax=Colletotrichum karsti TaxID=1095194 RepID=A0A9P6LKJ8_9PEZI|nr:uncharacterized protein CkaCkLH20_06566 [Colletotrichum karsti]KAF9876120.1 hypothetical protein CkaCkLH20_06566 [Colletotrichum karsti]
MYHSQLHQANQTPRHQLRSDHPDEQLETGSSSFSSLQHEGTAAVESNDAQGVTRLDRLPTEFIAMITQELMLSSTFQTRHDFISFSVCCKRLHCIVGAQKKAVFRDWMRMHYTDDQIKRVAHLLECIERRDAQNEIQAIQDDGLFPPQREMPQRDWVDKILTKKSWPWLWGRLTFMPSMRDVVAAHGIERQGEYFRFEDQSQHHEEACVGTLEAPSHMSSGM